MRQTPLRQALVNRLRDEVARRGLTASDLSKRAGYDERTAHRQRKTLTESEAKAAALLDGHLRLLPGGRS